MLVEGAGLARVGSADRPLIFTDPQSLSFGYLDVNAGAASRAISVTVADAGGGAGSWSVEVRPQVATSGATVEAAPFTIGSGGTAVVQMAARAAAGAPGGDNFGFIVLRRGSDVRRIPYAFSVTRPAAHRRAHDAAEEAPERGHALRATIARASTAGRPRRSRSSASSASTRP